MKSMTGFGRGTFTSETASLTVEVKTVNNRFLEVNLRMSSDLQEIEPLIKRTVSQRVTRGRTDVSISFDRAASSGFEVDADTVGAYLEGIENIKKQYSLPGETDINSILRLPNILKAKRVKGDPEAVASGVISALEHALTELDSMRRAEGSALALELEARLSQIEELMPTIEAEAAAVPIEYQARLNKRISELLEKSSNPIELDPARVAQEIAFLADRADISEEITRLKVHISQYRALMKEEKDVGKRLDFLTQELNREANTIASKTNNLKIKENALAIKSEIEKLREQIQNIE
jgi:uncharacterized protein (TIGR00255 family)